MTFRTRKDHSLAIFHSNKVPECLGQVVARCARRESLMTFFNPLGNFRTQKVSRGAFSEAYILRISGLAVAERERADSTHLAGYEQGTVVM